MRLIDADKLILHLNDYALSEAPDERESAGERRISHIVYSILQNCMKAVEEQPTAFDVERIVEQLDDEADRSFGDFEKYVDEIGTGVGPDDDWHYMGLRRALEIIEAAERLGRKNRWIPATERLPKEDGTYLVTFSDGTILTVGYGTCQRTVLGHSIGHGWYNLYAGLYYADGCVIAWMPLPECYKEEKGYGSQNY